jgi:DNA recombination protein RmuC
MVLEFLVLLTLLAAVGALVLAWFAWRSAAQPAEAPGEVLQRLALLQAAAAEQPRLLRDETARLHETQAREAAGLRSELTERVHAFQGHLTTRFDRLGEELREGQRLGTEAADASARRLGEFQRERLELMQREQKTALERVEAELKRLVLANAEEQAKARDALTAQMTALREAGEARQEKMRETLAGQLDQLRKENEAKLEQMRLTVDEKLQSTLDQRLDANFKQVSDRLESVQKGLGEMQTLATGVGDLKRVLTNVRARGTWGEVQLAALLEDSLTPEQYAAQVQVRPRSQERVDFAVRLPGHDEGGQVLLPIDCKFPHEDYARLVAAQEAADPVAVDAAGKALERAVTAQAKSLADKYIHPPHTTDFAYLYVPTEGLFAEIVRREGFAAELRTRYRVEVAGPSTLTALLNSLRVGFRSLQIQKKSSEVWTELGKVKTAFERYGDALDAVDKKLSEAKNKVADVSTRHKAVVRSLRNVEAVEILPGAPPLLALAAMPDADADDEAA